VSTFSSLVWALWYLRVTSLVGLVRSRLKRLRQPKYLAGALVGALYFYWIFFRRAHQPRIGSGKPGSPAEQLPSEFLSLLG
jgi:hypothetical protein